MRELSAETLKEDVFRLGGVVTRTRVLHPSGLRLHGPGEVLTSGHMKAMIDCAAHSVFLLEPGETEPAAARTLSGELREPRAVALGDVLLDDAVTADGRLLLKAGQTVDGNLLEAVRAARGPIMVRKRGLEAAVEKAKEYAVRAPGQPPRPPRPDTRLTQITGVKDAVVRPLLVPRAKAWIALREDMTRSIVANTIASEGHEVAEFRSPADLVASLGGRPDVVVVDLADAAAVGGAMRANPALRSTALLVAAAEGRVPEVFRALSAGANGSLPLPPRRDLVLEGLRSALRAMGKSVRVKPAILGERRKELREIGGVAVKLADRFLSRPLAVPTATVIDLGEGGMRIEYARPDWPESWAYVPHSVHPKHYWYNYSRLNALGRELNVSLTAPLGKTLEMMATFMHVSANGPFEVAGLQIRKSQGSVREHMTTVRGSKTTAVTRRF